MTTTRSLAAIMSADVAFWSRATKLISSTTRRLLLAKRTFFTTDDLRLRAMRGHSDRLFLRFRTDGNANCAGWREGGPNTASGERYDPSVWAAAIKTSLRQKFGGVQYGARPKYALVEAVGKKVVVKINDVGPLTPGRIIDFNERTMRHFDPSLQLGVIDGVRVRPLSGDYWIPGPVG